MDFWTDVWAQFWGNLLSGALLVAVGLWLEARLDEARERRHEKREHAQRKREKHD